ncbi:hypothetical protein NL676_005456 [Syzygium grande]|nr:hypothetical protein NL676_005456 [Syzygium grande]
MTAKEKLQKNDGIEAVDASMYRSLIGCLMYLTATRSDILFTEIVAQSTAKAKFIAATAATNQVLWLKKIMKDLWLNSGNCIEVYVDNQAALAISQNPVFHGKTKHFKIKFFFLREVQQSGEVKFINYRPEDQLADMFTKPLQVERFELLREKIGVCSSN